MGEYERCPTCGKYFPYGTDHICPMFPGVDMGGKDQTAWTIVIGGTHYTVPQEVAELLASVSLERDNLKEVCDLLNHNIDSAKEIVQDLVIILDAMTEAAAKLE